MRTRLYVVAVLGGIALLAITVVVVFAFGRHNPSPPSLEDNPRPEIPGEVLFQDRRGCFVKAAASGATREQLACVQISGGFRAEDFDWVDEDTVEWVRREGPSFGRVISTNLRTGESTDTGRTVDEPEFPINQPLPPALELLDGLEGPDGRWAYTNRDGDLVIVDGDLITSVASFDLPRYNRPHVRGWAPDGEWVLLEYWDNGADGPELWIVKADGSVRGTLAKDISPGRVAWRIEGVGSWPPPID